MWSVTTLSADGEALACQYLTDAHAARKAASHAARRQVAMPQEGEPLVVQLRDVQVIFADHGEGEG